MPEELQLEENLSTGKDIASLALVLDVYDEDRSTINASKTNRAMNNLGKLQIVEGKLTISENDLYCRFGDDSKAAEPTPLQTLKPGDPVSSVLHSKAKFVMQMGNHVVVYSENNSTDAVKLIPANDTEVATKYRPVELQVNGEKILRYVEKNNPSTIYALEKIGSRSLMVPNPQFVILLAGEVTPLKPSASARNSSESLNRKFSVVSDGTVSTHKTQVGHAIGLDRENN